MGSITAGTMGRTVTSVAFSPDGKTLVTGGFATKTNVDLFALVGAMNAASSGKRPKGQKGPTPPAPVDLKLETVGQVKLWGVATGQEVGRGSGRERGEILVG